MKKIMFVVVLGLGFLFIGEGFSSEHGGKTVKKEHEGIALQKGGEAPVITEQQIKDAITGYIQKNAKQNILTLEDKDDGGEVLNLRFVKIHDPVRKMKNNVYFACSDFELNEDVQKVYDIDFWLSSRGGKLKVTKTKVHKHPVLENGKWMKKARYTFQGDRVVPLP